MAAKQKTQVYLDGEIEDFNYLRRNILYVDFVNDPRLSHVQVVATRLVLGSGGRRYYLASGFFALPEPEAGIWKRVKSVSATRDRFKLIELLINGSLEITLLIKTLPVPTPKAKGKPTSL